ncbi:hypothetical protein R1sor_005073 [Riccia sorocarpa]|uniref:Uncharacterized protein n=1 Tax=Riccia sorocarpa TaxID=122646 RepID=A0ABD3HM01_9MARC
MDVDPQTLLFTQDSIKNTFKEPREAEGIDDAVEAILSGQLKASDFPAMRVVSYDGRLWCLDNRRLWVFKKARVPCVKIKITYNSSNPRFRDLITGDPALVKRILKPGYWPRVRGHCRSSFNPPAQNFDNDSPAEAETQFAMKILKAFVEKSLEYPWSKLKVKSSELVPQRFP